MQKRRKILAMFFIATLLSVGFLGFIQNPARAESENSIQDDISKYNKKLKAAQEELALEESQLYKNQSKIAGTKKLIAEITADISQKEKQLHDLANQAEANKKMLSEYIRQIYYLDQEDLLLSLSVSNKQLSDLSASFDGMLGVKAKIIASLETISNTKEEVEQIKSSLDDLQESNAQALASQKAQQAAIIGNVQESQSTIAELQKKLATLKSDLDRILGQKYDTGEIKDAIKFASKKTGVRAGYIFGMLSYESGGNPQAGNCTIKNCGMNSSRKNYFNDICDGLGYSSSKCGKMPLSCASKNYPGSGGAMGAAQFMPDTWWGYKSRIAAATGHDPPDPWSLIDGVVAMALKLEADGAAKSGKVSIKNPCTGKSVKVEWEIYASMRYLGWTCYGYTNYAPGVQSLAKGYDDL